MGAYYQDGKYWSVNATGQQSFYVGCQRGGIGARDAGGGVGVGLRTIAGGSGCGVSGTDDPTPTLSGLAGCFVQPICCIQLAIVSLVSGDQPNSGAFVAIICLVVSP